MIAPLRIDPDERQQLFAEPRIIADLLPAVLAKRGICLPPQRPIERDEKELASEPKR